MVAIKIVYGEKREPSLLDRIVKITGLVDELVKENKIIPVSKYRKNELEKVVTEIAYAIMYMQEHRDELDDKNYAKVTIDHVRRYLSKVKNLGYDSSKIEKLEKELSMLYF